MGMGPRHRYVRRYYGRWDSDTLGQYRRIRVGRRAERQAGITGVKPPPLIGNVLGHGSTYKGVTEGTGKLSSNSVLTVSAMVGMEESSPH